MDSKLYNSLAEAYTAVYQEGIRDVDPEKGTAERKAKLEKKRGMKMDDHPQYKKEEVEQVDENRAAMGRINKEYHRKKEADEMAARAKAPKDKKPAPKRLNDNPMYDAKSAGSSRVKGFKFTGEEVEQFDEDSRRTSNKQHTARVRSNIKSFGSNYTPPSNYDPDANRGKGEVLTRKQIEKKRRKALRAEEVENVEELYKGKHGQTDKQYADSRSQGGKMVSGDSKMSGAEYTHGRRVKAANPGMQPDVGGKTKPKSQGKMDAGTRADLQYRKANLKKEELEASGLFTEEEINAILEADEQFDEAMSSYDRNRKRAAQRAAERNAARAAGKTGVVPGVGYVSPRKERETYVDSAGTTRHKSGAKMP